MYAHSQGLQGYANYLLGPIKLISKRDRYNPFGLMYFLSDQLDYRDLVCR